IPWGQVALDTGYGWTISAVLIGYISVKHSSAQTFTARNVSSIPIQIILPVIRKSLCLSISLMRARICRWESTASAGLSSIHGRLELRRIKNRSVSGGSFSIRNAPARLVMDDAGTSGIAYETFG